LADLKRLEELLLRVLEGGTDGIDSGDGHTAPRKTGSYGWLQGTRSHALGQMESGDDGRLPAHVTTINLAVLFVAQRFDWIELRCTQGRNQSTEDPDDQ
jgi:hypothetical protein